MEPEGSMPHSQQLATCSYPVPNRLIPRNLSRVEAVFSFP